MNQIVKPGEPCGRVSRDEIAAPAGLISVDRAAPAPRREAGPRPVASPPPHVGRQFLVKGAAISFVAEEVMVADPRQALTPSRMVDQKLQALLGICPGSLRTGYQQGAGQAKGKGKIRRGLSLFRGV